MSFGSTPSMGISTPSKLMPFQSSSLIPFQSDSLIPFQFGSTPSLMLSFTTGVATTCA
ncbi:unknown protein [Bathycoccus prasinos]|uniref:Uncharacterized protein n=1 Tax=Bathycoccus prasinos TaxID=41875 RepID=K8F7E3_9CHLO|nr:unknown protein [Bathycoccus prasinos]CCO20760.1 unknown protein [Bathycoccus prasinos]|eukprot:XP_007508041.1 unknown protein [Bathycoccus prasinos]